MDKSGNGKPKQVATGDLPRPASQVGARESIRPHSENNLAETQETSTERQTPPFVSGKMSKTDQLLLNQERISGTLRSKDMVRSNGNNPGPTQPRTAQPTTA